MEIKGKKHNNKHRSHNAHYERNHRIITEGVLKLMHQFRVNISYAQIARKTGLKVRTIKNHSTDLNALYNQVESVLLVQYLHTMGKLRMNKARNNPRKINEEYYIALLLFMSQRRRIFTLICNDENNRTILHRMMADLYGRLIIKWYPENEPLPSIESDFAKMFIQMAVEIVVEWGVETRCRIEKSGDCLRKLQVLAEQAYIKCKLDV